MQLRESAITWHQNLKPNTNRRQRDGPRDYSCVFGVANKTIEICGPPSTSRTMTELSELEATEFRNETPYLPFIIHATQHTTTVLHNTRYLAIPDTRTSLLSGNVSLQWESAVGSEASSFTPVFGRDAREPCHRLTIEHSTQNALSI